MSEDRVMLSQNTYTSIKIILPIDVAVAVLTGLANCAFLIMLIKTKSLHKPSFVFLGALSTSDVLVGFVVQPLWIADYSFRVTGNFNENLFYIRGSVGWLCIGSSFLFIVLISLDMCIAVCRPFWYHVVSSCKGHLTISAVAIIIWCIFSAVGFVLFTYNNPTYIFKSTLTVTVGSLILLLYSFCKINAVLQKQRRQISVLQSAILHRQESQRFRQEKKRINVLLLLILILLACYLPYWFIVGGAFLKGQFFQCLVDEILEMWADFAVMFNSLLNPILYYARIHEIRVAMRKVFGFPKEDSTISVLET
ncbi:LOW QUALITY PROTEIN: 5-hydroxytryptamine receptor 1D-like [Rhopilema esculentum]|uniref:LOW QUALITY PROTEIN: 5-hydroxytryptamine receptor 1D-like n=1 Tax=Rhopilema esculentum TaxID=499914 RepID=UPI0031D7EF5D